MSNLPKIFIGSSSEGLGVARAIEQHLHDVGETTIWKYGVFRPGVSFLQSLLDSVDAFDFGVLALTPDDILDSRDESFSSPRDNVVFELGLFMGRLGPRRTFFVAEEDAALKLPSDLAGIARVDYRRRDNLTAAVSAACTVLRNEIKKQGCIARRMTGHAKTPISPPSEGPEHVLRLAARQFFGHSHDTRRKAAKLALQTGIKVSLDAIISMTESALPGERVAAGIALRAHIIASPNLAVSEEIAAVIGRGLDDSRSRVRFRFVQLLGDAPTLAKSFQKHLDQLLTEEPNEAVRDQANIVLANINLKP